MPRDGRGMPRPYVSGAVMLHCARDTRLALRCLRRAHHAFPDQRSNLAGAKTKLAEDLFGLRSEGWRRQANAGRLSIIAHGMIDERDRRAGLPAARNRHKHLHVLDLCILDDLLVPLYARVPDSSLLQAPAPFRSAIHLQSPSDQLTDLVLSRPGVPLGERGQMRLAERIRERLQ